MRALPSIALVVLAILVNGCVYVSSASESEPDGDAATRSVGQLDAVAMARPPAPLPRPPRVLGLNETSTLAGRLGEPPLGIPSFDVAVIDYQLADAYPNPIGGIERPPSGDSVLFILLHATNVTPLRGRPPRLAVMLGETALRGCLIAAGDRDAYDVMRDVLPQETVAGWLCRVLPSAARIQEISVASDRGLGGRWRLDTPATIAR